jgi:nucleotide-binding universal stress UspA family protein
MLTHIPCDKCRALVGSKSDFVLHNATCSVAIVRHSEDALEVRDPLVSSGGVRKIVIAVDESKEVNCTLTVFLALQQWVNSKSLKGFESPVLPLVIICRSVL